MQSNPLQIQLSNYLLQHLKHFEQRNIQCKHSGGAADINYMSHSEAVCIDGLGPVGGNLHCEDEYIEIESLVTRTQMVFELLKKIDTEVL
jgi:di/tripeptidase